MRLETIGRSWMSVWMSSLKARSWVMAPLRDGKSSLRVSRSAVVERHHLSAVVEESWYESPIL